MTKKKPASALKAEPTTTAALSLDVERATALLHVISIAVSKIGEIYAANSTNVDQQVFAILQAAHAFNREVAGIRQELITAAGPPPS